MKSILEQDHYTLLEVSPTSPKSEIVKAYHRLKAAFDPDSVATYALFSVEEARAVAVRVDEAFRVLIDERKKEIYDRWLQARARGDSIPEPVFTRDATSDFLVAAAVASAGTSDVKLFERRAPVLRSVVPPEPTDAPEAETAAASGTAGAPAAAVGEKEPIATVPSAFRPVAATGEAAATPSGDEETLKVLLSSGGDRDGAFFRAVRLARGIQLQFVSDRTKISLAYLRRIEENDFAALPAAVYLRGFLVQIARLYRLENPETFADAYMAVVERKKR